MCSFVASHCSTVDEWSHDPEQTWRWPSVHQPQVGRLLHEAQSTTVAHVSTFPRSAVSAPNDTAPSANPLSRKFAQVVQRDFDAQESSLDVGSKGGGAPHWPLIETHSLLQTFRPEHQPQPSAPWHDSHGCAAQ